MKKNNGLFTSKSGAFLDIGCGENKQNKFIGMDKRDLKGVDIVHDVQDLPYPIPTDSCFQVLMSHLWEHIEPKYRIDVMNELWRIIKPEGQLIISVPYDLSIGATQDPTHYTCPNEATFTYFDPKYPLYGVYKPKPWSLVRNQYQQGGNINAILEPIKKKGDTSGKSIKQKKTSNKEKKKKQR